MRAVSPHNEKLIPAKKAYTLQVGDSLIHSRYDPESEAEKYIASLRLKFFSFFILIEPGLGYLAAALEKQFPSSRVITLHCSPFFATLHKDDASWNPASSETLEDFLERNLENTDASEIKLVEWKPSINVYGKACLDVAGTAVECIRRISAGKKTVRNFGRRWFKNALRNLETSNGTAEIERGSVPVLVCAAGPGLEDSLDNITAWKQGSAPPFLLAVSSAVPALLYRNIKPDMIVTTDGGPWALFHITESYRYYRTAAFSNKEKPCIAASLTAALASQIKTWPVLFFHDGSLWQELLIRESGVVKGSVPVFPQRGTVSVSALDLAFSLSGGNVYVCGLDFAHRDLLTHSRPYAFEHFFEQSACRKHPLYSQIFAREAMIRDSGSLGIYASWFSVHAASFPKRLYTLGSSAHGIPPGLPAVNETGKPIRVTRSKAAANRSDMRNHLLGILLRALDNPLYSDRLCKELSELLITDKPGGTKEKLVLLKNVFGELV